MKRALFIFAIVLSLSGIIWSGLADSSPRRTKTTPATKAHPTAIRNVSLFDGERLIPNATVVFDKGLITAVGKNASVPANAEVIDGAGKTLLPGLIDSHTHAYGPALEDALRFGVTTELDMFTSVDALHQWKKEQNAPGGAPTRADIFSAGTLITVAGGHGTEYFKIPTFDPGGDAQAFVDARIAEGSDYIKLVYETGEEFGAHFNTLSIDDLRALIAAAHNRGKMTVVHVSTLEGARIAIDAGTDGLAHIFGDAPPDPDFAHFVAAHHAFVVGTLTVVESTAGVASGASLTSDSHLAPYLTSDQIASLKRSFPDHGKAHLENAFLAIKELHAAGVPILAGTDAPNPGTAHGASIHRELELLVRAGLTPTQALSAATSVPAAIFHLKDRGRIAVGLRADLLLVNGDPTANILATRDISRIWKGGVAFDRVPPAPPATVVSEQPSHEKLAAVIAGFESGKPDSTFGSGWSISTDQMMGGKSSADMAVVGGGANGTAKSLRINSVFEQGYAYPWAGAVLTLGTKPMNPVDLSTKHALVFYAKGDADIQVMLFATSRGPIPAVSSVHAPAEWTRLSVPFSTFGTDGKDVQAVLFGGDPSSGKVTFQIDEVGFE